MELTWKKLGLLVSAALIAWVLYRPGGRPELTVATVNNTDMILMQQLSPEFERQSGVKLNWVVLGENILRQRLTIDISTGSNTFDVITIGSYEAPLWGERGWLVPLDDLGADYEYDDIFKVIRQGLSYQNRMYAAPFYGEGSFTYYRRDLFQKAGLEMPLQPSYEQVRQFARELHDPEHGVYGICLRGEPGWGQNMAYISTLVNTFGGRWLDLDWKPQLTSPAWAEAVSFYVDLLSNYGPPGAITDGYNENRALFANGNCSMWVDATSAASYLLDPSQSRVAATTGFAKAPIAKVPNGASYVWSWAFAIPTSSKRAAVAKQFIKWATSRQYIATVSKRFGWLRVPSGSRESTYENPAYLEVAPFAPLVREAILNSDYTKPSVLPVPYVGIQYVGIPEFQAMGTEVGQEISAALAGRATVEQALALAQAEAERDMQGRSHK
ncbi:MAG: sugar ABC transporter substrate-binding protein [Terriglobia bacterium]|jgi:sorbitol/mannitol transport system substrate-binding protein